MHEDIDFDEDEDEVPPPPPPRNPPAPAPAQFVQIPFYGSVFITQTGKRWHRTRNCGSLIGKYTTEHKPCQESGDLGARHKFIHIRQ